MYIVKIYILCIFLFLLLIVFVFLEGGGDRFDFLKYIGILNKIILFLM